MKTTVTSYAFRRAFEQCRPNNFSYMALELLFDYFEEYEQDAGVEIELDVISICCEFVEMTEEEIRDSYTLDEEYDIADFLNKNTSVVGETKEGSFVFAQF